MRNTITKPQLVKILVNDVLVERFLYYQELTVTYRIRAEQATKVIERARMLERKVCLLEKVNEFKMEVLLRAAKGEIATYSLQEALYTRKGNLPIKEIQYAF